MEEILTKVAGQHTKNSYVSGDPESSMLPCGQVVGLIDEIKTVAQVIEDLIQEALIAMDRLKKIST